MQDTVRKTSFGRQVVASAPTSLDAFLEWSSRQPRGRKYELSRGQVFEIMINVTWAHALVCWNLLAEFAHKLDRTRFAAVSSDFYVRTPVGFRGPDVLVAPLLTNLKALATDSPILLVEVLSPSSVGIVFTEKVEEYTAIPSLDAYLICSQDLPMSWLFARESGIWPKKPQEIKGRDKTLPLQALGIELQMAAIFRGIPDPPQP